MKRFLSKYSYHCVKIFVDQIAIAIFGISLAISVGSLQSTPLTVAVSICSVIFFLVMIGQISFNAGVEDREKIQLGRFPKNNFTGFLIGIVANVLNLVLAIAYAVFGMFEATKPIAGGVNLAAKLIYGEYLGILSISVNGTKLAFMPISFFIITIPAIITCGIAYMLAVNGIVEIKPPKSKLE